MSGTPKNCVAAGLAALLLCAGLEAVQGQSSVPIPNYSFEAPSVTESNPSTGIPGWSVVSAGGYPENPVTSIGVYKPTDAQYPSASNGLLLASAEGRQSAFVSFTPGGGTSFREIGSPALVTTAANMRYDLTIALGHRNDIAPGTILIGLAVDRVLAILRPIQIDSVPAGTFQDFTLSLSTFGEEGGIFADKPMSFWLRIDAPASGTPVAVDFDNLRLTTNVPEPSVVTLALLLGALCMRRRGIASSIGSAKQKQL